MYYAKYRWSNLGIFFKSFESEEQMREWFSINKCCKYISHEIK